MSVHAATDPAANVIGQIHGGWTVAKALLGYERAMIADAFGASERGKKKGGVGQGSRLVQLARQYGFGDEGRLSDDVLRYEAALRGNAAYLMQLRRRSASK